MTAKAKLTTAHFVGQRLVPADREDYAIRLSIVGVILSGFDGSDQADISRMHPASTSRVNQDHLKLDNRVLTLANV